MSPHSIFSDETVNAVKEYVLEKFPSIPSSAQNKKRRLTQSGLDYDIARTFEYVKTSEDEDASARSDPSSCMKGICILKL